MNYHSTEDTKLTIDNQKSNSVENQVPVADLSRDIQSSTSYGVSVGKMTNFMQSMNTSVTNDVQVGTRTYSTQNRRKRTIPKKRIQNHSEAKLIEKEVKQYLLKIPLIGNKYSPLLTNPPSVNKNLHVLTDQTTINNYPHILTDSVSVDNYSHIMTDSVSATNYSSKTDDNNYPSVQTEPVVINSYSYVLTDTTPVNSYSNVLTGQTAVHNISGELKNSSSISSVPTDKSQHLILADQNTIENSPGENKGASQKVNKQLQDVLKSNDHCEPSVTEFSAAILSKSDEHRAEIENCETVLHNLVENKHLNIKERTEKFCFRTNRTNMINKLDTKTSNSQMDCKPSTSYTQQAEQDEHKPEISNTQQDEYKEISNTQQEEFKQEICNTQQVDFKLKKKVACELCNKSFGRPSELRRHLLLHTGERPHCCDECDKVFTQRYHLIRHVKSVHKKDLKNLVCGVCGETFNSEYLLMRHVKQHGTMTFACDDCGKEYKTKRQVKEHVLSAHVGMKPFKCPQCNKLFSRKYHLERHVMIHTGTKEYQCEYCGKEFGTKGNLIAHVRRVHLHIKEFSCGMCNKAFYSPKDLQTHLKTHTGEKPFQCDICLKQFSEKINMEWHLRIHSGERPYQCVDCNKSYTRLPHLIRHQREGRCARGIHFENMISDSLDIEESNQESSHAAVNNITDNKIKEMEDSVEDLLSDSELEMK